MCPSPRSVHRQLGWRADPGPRPPGAAAPDDDAGAGDQRPAPRRWWPRQGGTTVMITVWVPKVTRDVTFGTQTVIMSPGPVLRGPRMVTSFSCERFTGAPDQSLIKNLLQEVWPCPCNRGYMNSISEIGWFAPNRLLKSSRSSNCATIACASNSNTSLIPRERAIRSSAGLQGCSAMGSPTSWPWVTAGAGGSTPNSTRSGSPRRSLSTSASSGAALDPSSSRRATCAPGALATPGGTGGNATGQVSCSSTTKGMGPDECSRAQAPVGDGVDVPGVAGTGQHGDSVDIRTSLRFEEGHAGFLRS